MKYFIHFRCIVLFAFIILFQSNRTVAQCGAGFTLDTLKWDYLDFLPNSGTYVTPTAYINLAKSQTQYFTFGTQRVRVNHNYSGANVPGDNTTHTGSTGSFGTGADIQFIGNGSTTFTFDSAVNNVRFSVYDIDRNQRVTVTALNGLVPVNIVMARVTAAILTITGSGTPIALASASSSTAANTSSDGTANITIAGTVTSITVTITNTGTNGSEDGSFWISDLSACSPGTFPLNYYAVSRPFTNQPAYVLVSRDNQVYYVNVANGEAKFLFTDPGTTNINSMGYDPYRHLVYYTYSLTGSPATDRILRRYDYEQDTIGIVSGNVNNLGIPTYDAGVESGAAAFYNGSLYLGIEGYATSGFNSNRETAVWKMDFNASYAPTGSYAQVFAVPGDNGSGSILHDWSDFGISDGILYDFNGAASNRSFYHKNMLTGGAVNITPSPATLVPRQTAVDWTGRVYNVGSPSAIAPGTIAPYNYNGTVNTAQEYNITFNGVAITGSWGDAAEAFKPKTDFGDAPASYDPVSGDPATHEVTTNLRMGNAIDIEFTKKVSANATGDSFDDGMTGLLIIPFGTISYLRPVTVFNNTGTNATLIGWLDYNGDGIFQASEGRSVTVPSNASPQTANVFWSFINVTVPVGSTTFMRFRLTSSANGMTTSNPTGFYINGEVEDYAIIVANVLPDEAVDIKATKINTTAAMVKWSPVSESEFKGYELQKSVDGFDWQTIYITNVNVLNNLNYSFTDMNPSVPYSYYRIKILKSSGAYLYTDIRRLDFNGKASISINPNPARSTTGLTVQSESAGNATIRLIDYSGRTVHKENVAVMKGENVIGLPVVQKLSAGLYRVNVFLNGELLTTTLVVIQ